MEFFLCNECVLKIYINKLDKHIKLGIHITWLYVFMAETLLEKLHSYYYIEYSFMCNIIIHLN